MKGINPRQMQQMMRKMGIAQTEVEAQSVLIRTADKDIIIDNPQVLKVNMMGADTWQISGEAREELRETTEVEISEEDVQTVMDQCHCSKDAAKDALMNAGGDLAKAILSLQEQE